MAILRIAGLPPIPVGDGTTLLQAALAVGVDMPHGCRSGLCGACRVALLEGRVEHDTHTPAALSADERAAGIVLACRARPLGDVRLAFPAPRMPAPTPRRFATRVVRVDRLGPRTLRLVLESPPGGLAFLAGQYATIGFAGAAPRDFSFAGMPGDPALVFHLRQAGTDGTADAAGRLRRGDPAMVEGPFGIAYFREDDPGPLLLVAAGTGLAPMLSVARAALAANPARRVSLFRPLPSRDDPYGVAEQDALAAGQPTFALHEPAPEALVQTVLRAAGTGPRPTVHAAGPPAMVADLDRALTAAPRRPWVLRADAFTPVAP